MSDTSQTPSWEQPAATAADAVTDEVKAIIREAADALAKLSALWPEPSNYSATVWFDQLCQSHVALTKPAATDADPVAS